jgi:signal transduction histidine kinase/CheY-like chemotaxis protein
MPENLTKDNPLFSYVTSEGGINLQKQAAFEKLAYMYKFAKSSTVATIVAPLLTIPLYLDAGLNYYIWMSLMVVAVVGRLFILKLIDLNKTESGIKKINIGVGSVTLVWGLGWLFLDPSISLNLYLIYLLISLTVLYVGMVGYCVNWSTFLIFVLTLKIPEAVFIVFYHDMIFWPAALGSMATLGLALRMGFLFGKSWERSILLRNQNEELVNQLIAEKDASVAANVAKSEFIATASHDLRQPMHAINLYLDTINLEEVSLPIRNKLIKMKTSALTLNGMFDNLLNISKLDARTIKTKNIPFSLHDLVETVYDLVISKANNKEITLKFSAPNANILGNKMALQQIILNLTLNAIQYTDKGFVDVGLSVPNGKLLITIEDTGAGISEVDQLQIFNEFFRAESTRGKHDGLGLGLTIVKRLCDQIDAKLNVTSKLGEGAIFTVQTNYEIFENEIEKITNQSAKKSDAQRASLVEKLIVLIEDDPVLVDAYRNALLPTGANVFVLTSFETNFESQFEEINHVDCIVSDYQLGVTTGDAVINRIREFYNKEIPAIIVTADTSPDHVAMFDELNIPVLHKPITFEEIVKSIEKLIAAE